MAPATVLLGSRDHDHSGNLGSWALGLMGSWELGIPGTLAPWAPKHLAMGHLGNWACLGIWAPGLLGTWLLGT
jgi:hypothetical protein